MKKTDLLFDALAKAALAHKVEISLQPDSSSPKTVAVEGELEAFTLDATKGIDGVIAGVDTPVYMPVRLEGTIIAGSQLGRRNEKYDTFSLQLGCVQGIVSILAHVERGTRDLNSLLATAARVNVYPKPGYYLQLGSGTPSVIYVKTAGVSNLNPDNASELSAATIDKMGKATALLQAQLELQRSMARMAEQV